MPEEGGVFTPTPRIDTFPHEYCLEFCSWLFMLVFIYFHIFHYHCQEMLSCEKKQSLSPIITVEGRDAGSDAGSGTFGEINPGYGWRIVLSHDDL